MGSFSRASRSLESRADKNPERARATTQLCTLLMARQMQGINVRSLRLQKQRLERTLSAKDAVWPEKFSLTRKVTTKRYLDDAHG